MAMQASIAISIAEMVRLYAQLDRGYWITLTAMALTAQTWGESVKRSFERVGMTALGGMIGTVLYFYVPHDMPGLLVTILLLFVFFTVYTLKIAHLLSVFFLTGFVVFLFAILGNWNWQMLQMRIFDTAIGAVIALGVGCFFFSNRTDVRDLLCGYLQKMKAVIANVFFTRNQARTAVTGKALADEFQQIKKDACSIRYELLFHRLNPHRFHTLLNQIEYCTLTVLNLTESYEWLMAYLSPDEREAVLQAAKTTVENIEALVSCFNQHTSKFVSAADVSELLNQAIARDPGRFASLESNALGFFSVMYIFTRLNQVLGEAYALIKGAYPPEKSLECKAIGERG